MSTCHHQVYSVLYDAWTNIIPVDSSGNDAPDEAPTSRYGIAFLGEPEAWMA
jgi:hypothetical protein